MLRFQCGRKAPRGFTLVELLIVIGVIVVLIALLLPSVASVRARARSVEAQSNLTQLGLALNAANRNRSTPVMHKDSDGILWTKQIQPFLEGENEALFVSPADPNAEERGPDEPSFAANNQMHRMGSGDGRKIVILDFEEEGLPSGQDGVFDAAPPGASNQWTPEVDENWQNALDAAGQRQGGNVNVLRHDGSVSSESAQDLMDYHPQNSPEDWVPWRTDNEWICPDGPDGCSPPEALVTDLTPDVPDAPPEEEEEDPNSGGEDTGGEDTGGEESGDEEDTAEEEPADPGCSGDAAIFLDCPVDLPPNTMTSGWNVVASPNPPGFEKSGFDGFREAASGNGNAVFTWRFLDLPNGRYSVSVNWGQKGNRATNVSYKVAHDFGTLGTSDAINQKVAPQADFQDAAAPNATIAFQKIGVFDVLHGHLYVSVDNNTNGTVCADAVRIQCVGSADTVSDCPEGPGAGFVNGLYGEYRMGQWNFGDDPATAEPFVARIDADMNEPYGGNFEPCDHPAQNPADCWSGHGVKWVGEIRAPFAEEYQFYVARDDATRVIINGQTVVDSLCACWDPPGALPIPVGDPVSMSDCEWVPIEILNGEAWGISFFRLQWSSFSTPLQDIPTENFRTTPLP